MGDVQDNFWQKARMWGVAGLLWMFSLLSCTSHKHVWPQVTLAVITNTVIYILGILSTEGQKP